LKHPKRNVRRRSIGRSFRQPSGGDNIMSNKQKMVVIVTNGFNDERSSVAWSVANGGIGMGFEVTMFMVSSGVDWVRKGAAEVARPNPLDPPIKDMIQTVLDSGGEILVCPPCAGVRGYKAEDLIDGVTLAGSAAMLERAAQGAVTVSF
jgi:predicted peroxiredoxin